MSDSSKRDLRKVKSACLLVLLLLPGIMIALPAVSIFHVSASTGSTPASVVGATATIDYPIYASIANGAQLDTRVITITNPVGNPSITTFTLSIPTGAVKSGSAPYGAIMAGGVPDCTGITGHVCDATVFGSGPYSLQYTDTHGSSGAAILPPGASIQVNVTIVPEQTTTSSSSADTFTFSAAVTDTTSANTQLNAITVYMTKATALSNAGPGPAVTQVTAGSVFTFTATANQTGLQVYAAICNHNTNASCTTGTASKTTISPASFTTTANSAQTITVNDTTIADSAVSITVGGPAPNAGSSGGILTNSTSTAIQVLAGTATKLAITVGGVSSSHVVNVTSSTWAGGVPIAGTTIFISATDKFGNVAGFTGVSLNVAVNTLSGQTAGFSTQVAYAGSYPYAPTGGVLASLTSFAMTSNPMTLTTNNFFFGVDYGSTSQITVAATGASLASATSSLIKTYTLTTQLASIGSSTLAPKAGATYTLTATGISTLANPAQAGVPVWFLNATDYSTLTSTATKALTTVSSSGTETATWTVTAPTTAGTSTSFNAEEVLFNGGTATFTGTTSPLTNSSAQIGAAVGPIRTAAGTISKLVVNAYFANPATQVFSLSTWKTTYGLSTVVIPSATMYIDVVTTDANGNVVTVTGVTQVALSSTAGTLSVTTVLTIPNNGTDLASSDKGSNTAVAFVAPATVGSTATITATGAGLTGSVTITVVTATPNLVVTTAPTSIVTGVPSTFSGIVNATKGALGATITSIIYSVNGGAPSTVTIGAANAAWTFSVLLTAKANSVNITALDSRSKVNTVLLSVPAIPAAQTFTNSTDLKQVSFVGGPVAVNATFTNNAASTLTVIIVANVLNAQGAVILESTATVTATAGQTVSGYPVIQGIAHGTYTVSVTVYSTAYVTLSPTTTVSVTV
jgi:hypothetical protein